MNKTERERITAHIREDHPYIVALRRHFHRHPEIAKEEFHTAERIEAELDKIGLVHRRVGGTGVYAEIQGKKPGKTPVLRADIDALPIQETHTCEYMSSIPGRMHACGHDAHTASLIGAARILAACRSAPW